MTTVTAVGGWIAAGVAGAVVLLARRFYAVRMVAVARACHELRGPLAAVRLGLSLGGRPGELSQVRLAAMDSELGRAALALDDLAGVADTGWRASGAGRPPRYGQPARYGRPAHCGRVDAFAVARSSGEAWRASASAAGAAVQLRCGMGEAVVWGDRLRLAQAVGNLLANAIEHGSGDVELVGVVRDATVRIEISDNGPGLPASVAEIVRGGQRSRRRPPRRRPPRRRPPGRGHGLKIASDIATTHGGRVYSAPSATGARLVLELPLAAAATLAG